MKRVAVFSLTLGSVVLLLGAIGAGTASASSSALCKENETPCAEANRYSVGTEMKLTLGPGTQLVKEGKGIYRECNGAAAAGTTATTGGLDKTVEATLGSLSFSECTCTTKVLKPGRLRIEGVTESMNGKVTWEGEVKEECGTSSCLVTKVRGAEFIENYPVGFTLEGGNKPALHMAGATAFGVSFPGEGNCNMAWWGEFPLSSPQPLYVAAANTVLCKTTASPCNEEEDVYGKGTTWSATLKSGAKSTLEGAFGSIQCEESTIKGEVTAAGGAPWGFSEESTRGKLTSASFAKCNCSPAVHMSTGSFSVTWAGGTSGNLGLSGIELNLACESPVILCNYGTSVQEGIYLEGGSAATIRMEKALLPKKSAIAGECGENVKWSAEYEVTTPKPLYVGLSY